MTALRSIRVLAAALTLACAAAAVAQASSVTQSVAAPPQAATAPPQAAAAPPQAAAVPPQAAAVPPQAAAPDLVDRIVAIVNGEVITLSQLRRGVSLNQEGPDELSGTALCSDLAPAGDGEGIEHRVLDCMIDHIVVFQHVRRFPQFGVSRQQIDDAFARLVASYESREAFEAALQRQGRTEAEVRYDLQRQALIENYIDLRYRSITEVRQSEMQRYYDEVLVPEMEREGAAIPPFDAVASMIRPILVEGEVNRRVDAWITDLRRRAEIVVYLW